MVDKKIRRHFLVPFLINAISTPVGLTFISPVYVRDFFTHESIIHCNTVTGSNTGVTVSDVTFNCEVVRVRVTGTLQVPQLKLHFLVLGRSDSLKFIVR